jgi:hypothetical protein
VLPDRVWAPRGNLSTYDAVYVALAEVLDATVLTCDGRLARAPGAGRRVDRHVGAVSEDPAPALHAGIASFLALGLMTANWFILLCAVMAFIGIRAAVIRAKNASSTRDSGSATINTSAAPVQRGLDPCGDREGSA